MNSHLQSITKQVFSISPGNANKVSVMPIFVYFIPAGHGILPCGNPSMLVTFFAIPCLSTALGLYASVAGVCRDHSPSFWNSLPAIELGIYSGSLEGGGLALSCSFRVFRFLFVPGCPQYRALIALHLVRVQSLDTAIRNIFLEQ